MMKFSKSPFPDPGKRPRRGGGTRPRGPERRRGHPPASPPPPPWHCHANPKDSAAPRPEPPPPRAALGGCGAARVIFAVIPPSHPPAPRPPPPLLPARFCNMEPGSRGGKGGRSHFLVHISRRLPASLGSRRRCRAPRPLLAARTGALPGAPSAAEPPSPGRAAPTPSPSPSPSRSRLGTHLGDHPLHFTRYSTLPCGAREATTRRQLDPPPSRTTPPHPPSPAADLPPHPPALLTFRIRFFSMLSTAKTCSPTAGSSMLQPGGAGPGVRGRRCLQPSRAPAPAAPAADPTDTEPRPPRHRNPCKSRSETSGRRCLPGPAARQRRGRGIGADLPGSEAGRGRAGAGQERRSAERGGGEQRGQPGSRPTRDSARPPRARRPAGGGRARGAGARSAPGGGRARACVCQAAGRMRGGVPGRGTSPRVGSASRAAVGP